MHAFRPGDYGGEVRRSRPFSPKRPGREAGLVGSVLPILPGQDCPGLVARQVVVGAVGFGTMAVNRSPSGSVARTRSAPDAIASAFPRGQKQHETPDWGRYIRKIRVGLHLDATVRTSEESVGTAAGGASRCRPVPREGCRGCEEEWTRWFPTALKLKSIAWTCPPPSGFDPGWRDFGLLEVSGFRLISEFPDPFRRVSLDHMRYTERSYPYAYHHAGSAITPAASSSEICLPAAKYTLYPL